MKGQVLADFVAQFSPMREMEMVCRVEVHPWKVFVDDVSSTLRAGAEIVIITSEVIRLEHSFSMKPYLPN